MMDANREWWGWDGKPPAVDRIIWKPIPDDFARLSALQRGEVDVITNVPPDQMKIVRTLTVPATRTVAFCDEHARSRRWPTSACGRRCTTPWTSSRS